eukprot:GHUV01055144.1.p2 GENE.GHUV01055144.1~~GHUV01055144.1.p2  ORF type:complete len:115 (+),score=24.20 GHUV01055144.1:982-1326(+)
MHATIHVCFTFVLHIRLQCNVAVQCVVAGQPAVVNYRWPQQCITSTAAACKLLLQITVELSKLPKSGAAARADPSLQNGREGIPAIVEQQHRPTKRRRESSEIVVEQGVVIDLT